MNPNQRRAMYAKQKVRRLYSEDERRRMRNSALIGAAAGVPLFPIGSVIGATVGYYGSRSRIKKGKPPLFGSGNHKVRRIDK